jgi:deazaflavin-dependent oxidoreductase (nitroreductase family)
MSETSIDPVEDPQYLYLTTTGRRTGLPREIEIWFVQRSGRHYLVAEHAERSQWVRNLLADSKVSWQVRGVRYIGQARVVDPAKEPALSDAVRSLSRAKYGWGEGLVVELTPAAHADMPA